MAQKITENLETKSLVDVAADHMKGILNSILPNHTQGNYASARKLAEKRYNLKPWELMRYARNNKNK